MGKNLKILFTQEEKEEYQKIELKMLKEGNTGIEIARKIGISEDMVSSWKNELIDRGEITQEEIEEARRIKKEKEKAEAKKTDPARQFVLEKRLEGKSLLQIVEEGPYGQTVVWRNIKELEEEGLATKEMVEEARRKRKEEEKKIAKEQKEMNGEKEIDDNLRNLILEALKKGLSSKMIIKKLAITAEILGTVKKQLIDAGEITPEKIKKAQKSKLARDKKKTLKLVLEGLSISEIVEKIEDSYYDYIQDLIKELKGEGTITDEKIKKAKFERNQRKIMVFVIDGFEEGLNQQEITNKYHEKYGETISRQTVGWYKKKILEEGIMTEEEIKRAQKERQAVRNDKRRIESRRTLG